MRDAPRVSVVVPVYNAGQKLIPSIDSLLNQTLKNIEIIIVNDASTDESGRLIDRLACDHDNIVPIHLGKNSGVHEARLAGLKKSTAPWIGFLDADDFARPNMFEFMYSRGMEHAAEIVVCGSYRVTPSQKIISSKLRFKRSTKVENGVFEKFCRFAFGTGTLWNKLYRRELIVPCANMRFPWRQDINEDLILNIGCFHRANSVYLCKEMLYNYVLNGNSVTSTTSNAKAYVDTYRAAALAIDSFSELGPDVLSKIIDMYRIQLSWDSYLIDDIHTIIPYQYELQEAIDLISSVYPAALALLNARRRPALVGVRLATRSLLHRSLIMLGLDPASFKR